MRYDHLAEDELLALQDSVGRGNWGFSTKYTQGIQQQLLAASVPPWMARCWTIHLNALKWPGDGVGLVAPGTLGNWEGPDNQVLSAYVNSTDQATGFNNANNANWFNAPLRLRLEWGVQGAMEVAYLDYPSSGGSFQVSGADIRLYTDGGSNASFTSVQVPIMGGFILAQEKAPSDGQFESRPLLTIPLPNINASGTLNVGVPRRAVAYRGYSRFFQNDGTLGFYPGLVQVTSFAGTVICTDQQGTMATAADQVAVHRAQDVFPLSSTTQAIQVANNHATQARQYQLEFLLDFGG
jgi:hypothetical protein